MDTLDRETLLSFLNDMLEAERAGARALLKVARDAEDSLVADLASDIHHDEARWCAMLTKAIKALGGTPSQETGAFYEKVMGVEGEKARIALVNRGQGWVVRKLSEVLPKISDPVLSADLTEMLASHQANIERVDNSYLNK